MRYCAILTFLVGYCAFSFSQELLFSRKFIASKKNLPLSILNNHTDYFFVLRYNKAAHDITIERRAKSSAEIISFTPLKLDSVNASWFDYQKLDYLFFEQDKQLCFLFEKVTNSRKTLYLKIIDTLAKSSGFIELANISMDKSTVDISFEYKRAAGNILIVASQFYHGSASKKVMLFDIKNRRMLWTKKLPFENSETGFSIAFTCNTNHDLFYACVKSTVVGYQRKFQNQMQVNVPVYFYETISLVSYLNTDPVTVNRRSFLVNVSALSDIQILPGSNDINVQCHYALKRTEDDTAKIYFINTRLDKSLNLEVYQTIVPLENSLQKQLTFYDGGDYNNPAEKEYTLAAQLQEGRFSWSVIERKDPNYYKEMLGWKADLVNGKITKQFIIPRRLYGFKNKTRFKYGGESSPFLWNDRLCFIVAESPSNLEKDPNAFNFKKFKVESNPWRANIVMYSLDEQDVLSKKLIYHNTDFDMIPLRYEATNVKDVIFYMTSNKYEKFAILQ